MILILIFVIGGLAMAVSMTKLLGEDSVWMGILWGVFFIPLLPALALVLGTMLAVGIGYVCTDVIPSQEYVVEERPIFSLNDTTSVTGRFTLGSGYFDEDLCIYYVVEDDAGKSIQRVKRENAVIVESDEDEPTVKVTGKKYKSKAWNLLVLDVNEVIGASNRTTLTVPTGTVTTAYNVDLE